jgi:hypothetical protein
MPNRANKAWEKQNGKEDLEEVEEARSNKAPDGPWKVVAGELSLSRLSR